MVIIIVTKKINSKTWPMSPTAANARTMATMASPKGRKGGDDSAEERQQNDERDRDAEPLPLLQVFGTQLVVLEGYAGVSADEHAKVVRAVRFPDDVNDILDVLRRLV